MGSPNVDWNKIFEFSWRILVFVVAIGIIVVVSTNWTRWEGGAGWQTTDDAYLQADLTPIAAKVGGYVSELPIQDYQRVHKGQVLAQLVEDDYRAAVAQAEANVASARAKADALQAQVELQRANILAARAVVASTTAASAQNEREVERHLGFQDLVRPLVDRPEHQGGHAVERGDDGDLAEQHPRRRPLPRLARGCPP